MKFVRSGGFAGLSNTVELDSDTLSAEDQKTLLELIENANFFDNDFDSVTDSIRDGFSYEITIEKGSKKRTVNINDGGISKDLRPLVDHLVGMIRRSRK